MSTRTSMRSYKVANFGQALIESIDPLPEPKGAEVLLRVSACGVCHSDLHLSEGRFDLGGGQFMDLTRAMQLPRTLGHEIVGEVRAVGPDADEVFVGVHRLVYPWIGCGECGLCASGAEHLCAKPRALGVNIDGGFADHVLVPDAKYLLDFGQIPEPLACTLACSGLTAYSALKKAPPLATDDRILIIGAGGVGLAAVRLAQPLLGTAPIVAEVDRGKWDAATLAGAVDVIDPTAPDIRKNLIRATGGFAAVFDFVGIPTTSEFGMAVLRKGGRMILVGLFGGSLSIALPTIPMRAISLVGSYVGSLEELRGLVALARDGGSQAMPLTARPLADAQASLEALRTGRVVGRIVLTP